MGSRASRTPPRDMDETVVRVKASLKDLSLDMNTVKARLFKASVSGKILYHAHAHKHTCWVIIKL